MKKQCTKCGEKKPLSEFNKCKARKDGLQGYCKICDRKAASENYQKDIHENRLKRQIWQDHNRERHNQHVRDYFARKKDNDKQEKSYCMIDKHIDIECTRELVYKRDGGVCENCKKVLQYTQFQMAHRIKKGKGSEDFIKRYALNYYNKQITTKEAQKILNHEKNLATTCPGACNDAMNIFYNPLKRKLLIDKIWECLYEISNNDKRKY